MKVCDRAREDVEAGRLWKARDRLTGALVHPLDERVLPLLGDVLHRMGDLPAAGAVWFATGQDDDRSRAARAAWRERHGDDALQLWLSLPPTVRSLDRPDVRLLRAQATEVAARRVAAGKRVPPNAPLPVRKRIGAADVVFWIGASLGLVLALVGAWTVVTWIF